MYGWPPSRVQYKSEVGSCRQGQTKWRARPGRACLICVFVNTCVVGGRSRSCGVLLVVSTSTLDYTQHSLPAFCSTEHRPSTASFDYTALTNPTQTP
ncbi:hypothetical protein J6590_030457 [Homalodisca vitripennis]|nr:hypothetical protein J6590_030457 [Homalodisca vitripennis]